MAVNRSESEHRKGPVITPSRNRAVPGQPALPVPSYTPHEENPIDDGLFDPEPVNGARNNGSATQDTGFTLDSILDSGDDGSDHEQSINTGDDLFDDLGMETKAIESLKSRDRTRGHDEPKRPSSFDSMQHALSAEYDLVARTPDSVKRIKKLVNRENEKLFDAITDNHRDDGMPMPVGGNSTEVLATVDELPTIAEADRILGLDANDGTSKDSGDGLSGLDSMLALPYHDPDDEEPVQSESDRKSMDCIISNAKRWIALHGESSSGSYAPGTQSDGDGGSGNGSHYVVRADEQYVLLEPDDGKQHLLTRDTLDDLMNDAIDRGASDIHIAPNRHVKLRINGSLYTFMKYEMLSTTQMDELIQDAAGFISHENQAYLNTNKSSDSAYVVRSGKHKDERFRVHFLLEYSGIAIVMRHIRPEIFKPEEIGLPKVCLDWTGLSSGLVLVTGPTGSGKSASLSSMLHKVQMEEPKKIITLEEPIETVYPLEGRADVIQREIPDDCPSFVKGIRDAMREDPDVILVGEIRDFDTIDAALQASNTGHLTFATIHANSAPDVITRVLDLAGEGTNKDKLRSDLSRQLKGIMSQRLLLKPGNDGRVAVREIVRIGKRQSEQIMNADVEGMMDDLRRRGQDMDSQMIEMLLEQRTVLTSAHEACSDREAFDERISMLPDEWKHRILLDADRTGGDDEEDEQEEDWGELVASD